MSDKTYYFGCPACCSFAGAESEEEAERRADAHNGYRHDDEKVARLIEPDSTDSLDEFMDEAREMAKTKQYEALVRKVTRGNTPFNTEDIIG